MYCCWSATVPLSEMDSTHLLPATADEIAVSDEQNIPDFDRCVGIKTDSPVELDYADIEKYVCWRTDQRVRRASCEIQGGP